MGRDLLVVGLGNPGPRYQHNRHNFGFMVLEKLAEECLYPVTWQEKFSGQITKITRDQITYTLLKPMTFMNLSGKSVARAVQFFGFALDDIVVVHDEIDLEFETVRVKAGGRTAGHKGLRSIKNTLGESGFNRVRMGVGRPEHGSVSDYVLSDFSIEEQRALSDVIHRGSLAVQMIAKEGMAAAMNEFNRRR